MSDELCDQWGIKPERYAALTAERDELKAELNVLREQRDERIEQVKRLNAELDRLRAELKALHKASRLDSAAADQLAELREAAAEYLLLVHPRFCICTACERFRAVLAKVKP